MYRNERNENQERNTTLAVNVLKNTMVLGRKLRDQRQISSDDLFSLRWILRAIDVLFQVQNPCGVPLTKSL